MFNIFKRRKPSGKQNQVYLSSDNRVILGGPYGLLIRKIIRDLSIVNNIYDDDVYSYILDDYNENYEVYDLVPLLLPCRVPKLMYASHRDMTLKASKAIYNEIYKSVLVNADDLIPELFHITKVHEDLLMGLYDISIPYMDRAEVDSDEFRNLIRYHYLKEWDAFFFGNMDTIQENVVAFDNLIISFIKSRASNEDNKQTIHNVIERRLEKIAKDAQRDE